MVTLKVIPLNFDSEKSIKIKFGNDSDQSVLVRLMVEAKLDAVDLLLVKQTATFNCPE